MFWKNIDTSAKNALSQRDKDRAIFLKAFLNLVIKYDHFVLFPHVKPDGDTLGCVFGFKEIIRTNYPNKKAYVVGDNFGLYPWMHMEFDNFLNYGFDFTNAVAIIFDVGESPRIQQFEKFFKNSQIQFGAVVKIDHHGSISDFHLDLSWDDPTYVAACCQVIQIADFYGWKLSPRAASFLYLGVCTDSLCFTADSTLPRSLILAAKTWRSGAEYRLINRNLNRRTWKSISAENFLLNNCTKTENIIWFKMTLDIKEKLGIKNTKGYVNVFKNIEENWVWLMFAENEDHTYDLSIRSVNVSVRDIAIKYGGGGHDNASGVANVQEDKIPLIVNDCEQLVSEAKKKSLNYSQFSWDKSVLLEQENLEALKQTPKIIGEVKEFLKESEEMKQQLSEKKDTSDKKSKKE